VDVDDRRSREGKPDVSPTGRLVIDDRAVAACRERRSTSDIGGRSRPSWRWHARLS